jgi:NitT/TauT family transport system substrate-binding protein
MSQMRVRAVLAGVLASLIVVAAAPAPADPPVLIPVRVGVLPNDDMMSVLYATTSGMFRRAGLDVTLEKSSNGPAIAAAVLGGSYDIGKSSITPIIDAHAKGVPFVIIAAAAIYESKAPYGGLISNVDVPLETGKDLAGKIVGTNALGDIGQIGADAWAARTGGDPTAFKYIEIPMPATPAALDQGRIVAGGMVYPPMARALATGKYKLTPVFDAIAPAFLFSAWFTTIDFATKHPDVVKTFARVVSQAAAYTNTHHDETAPILSDFSSVPVDVIEHMPRVTNGTSVSAAQLQPVIDASAKYGDLKQTFPAAEIIAPGIATK